MFGWIDWVVAVLMDLELSLYRSMGRNLQRHKLEQERQGFRWTQWQAVQLRGLRSFRRKLSSEVNKTFEELLPYIEQHIEEAYQSGQETFDKAILDAQEQGVRLSPVSVESFAGVHEERLKTVILDVRSDMDKARYGAAQRAGAIYEDIIKRADVAFQTGTTTLLDSVEYATKEAAKQGLNAIEYEDGKRVNVSSYVEMALRTSARRAANEAEGVKREEWGIFTVISPTLHSTCDTCQEWQGKILIDDVFSKGKPDGKHPMLSEAMKPPSHFQGPNCLVSGMEVLATGVKASSSRRYIGEVVTIFTSGGNKLTVTPNHPILTDKGWVGAGSLKKGDKVVQHVGRKVFTSRTGPNDIHVPTAVEDVPHALRAKTSRLPNVVVVSPVDFHGDGANSEIAVVNTYGLLGGEVNTVVCEDVSKTLFMDRVNLPNPLTSGSTFKQFISRPFLSPDGIMGVFNKVTAFFGRKLRHAMTVSFGKRFKLAYSSFSHAFVDGHLADPEMLGDVLFGHTGIPKTLDLIHREDDFVNSCLGDKRRPQVAKLKPRSLSPIIQITGADAENVGDLLDSLSRQIKFTDIVDVNRWQYSGHVHNLETESGWYVAESIITHNCRHPLTVYIPGVTQIPKKSDFDQTKSNYEAEQQQRYIERKIREWKRQEALSVNKDEKAKAALKVKTWQAAMREFLRHQPQLRRNPQREKLLD